MKSLALSFVEYKIKLEERSKHQNDFCRLADLEAYSKKWTWEQTTF